jgi:hypothetical protein
MELTKSEIQIADRYLSKREKQVAQWPIRRWLILVIFSVFALIGYRNVRLGEASIQDDKATDMQVSQALEKDPPPGLEHRWAIGSMMKISKILELRHQVVSYALMQVTFGYVQSLSGAIMVGLIILRWNVAERDALICKLLRAKLQELEQDAARSNRPPPLSPASPEVPSPDAQRAPASGVGR